MQENGENTKRIKWVTPAIMAVSVFLLVLVLASGLSQQEHQNMQAQVRTESDKLISYIESNLNHRIQVIERMASRWETEGGTPQIEFERDAYHLHQDLPGFQAIEWVDKDFFVRWAVPTTGNESVINKNIAVTSERVNALQGAKNRRSPTLTPVNKLIQGGNGLLITVPIYSKGNFDGFVVGVIKTAKWLDSLLTSHEDEFARDDFIVSVYVDGDKVFMQDNPRQANINFEAKASVRILGHIFAVGVKPTNAFANSTATSLPFMTLIFGSVFALLAGITVFLLERTTQQTKRLVQARNALKQEVVERKQVQDELFETSNTLTIATNSGRIGVWSWDLIHDKLSWNNYMYEFYGLPTETPPSYKAWENSLHPDDKENTVQLLNSAVSGAATFDTEFRIVKPNGSIRYIQASATVVKDDEGKAIRMIGINMDITEQKEAEEIIRHMANYDTLTDLPTRRLAMDRLKVAVEAAKRNKQRFAILYMDLDGFKQVNDEFGHDAGDIILTEVANRLKGCVRKSDTIARLGGDEFLAILNNIQSEEGLKLVAKKIIAAVSNPIMIENNRASIGISIGISIFPTNSINIDDLLKQADDAMYTSKEQGKNNITFSKDKA